MKKNSFISKNLLQTAFGMVLALFVLTQSVFVQEQSYDQQEQRDSEEEKGETQQISKAEAVPTSSLQINLDYQSYLLNEVFFPDEDEYKSPAVKQILPSAQKALKILFRRIISPNAP
ncbi:hypothetical protein [Ekhidna sp.]|uniref:hypothetical protein n=1 Tax=Ekhidna sp. TaxID=2608089 RepID=UPI003C7D7ABB